MFAGMAALVLPHHGEGFLGHGTHFYCSIRRLQVDHGAYVQATDRGMGVPGARGAMLGENLGQAVGIFGQVLQAHGAVFNEGYRFAVALHGHHDVQAGFAHLPNLGLETGVRGLDHGAGEAQIAHQFHQLSQLSQLLITIIAGEFHQ